MAYEPIALIIPQYDPTLYAGHWLKAYNQGTVTPLAMATDSTGGTTLAKCELDAQGFPITAGSARFTPFINGAYDIWLFQAAPDADANDTTNAIQMADNITAGSSAEIAANTALIATNAADIATNAADIATNAADIAANTAAIAANASLLVDYEVTGSDVTNIDFTGLDMATQKSYRVEIEMVPGTTATQIQMQFNNVTTLYTYQRIRAALSVISTAVGATATIAEPQGNSGPGTLITVDVLQDQNTHFVAAMSRVNEYDATPDLRMALYNVSRDLAGPITSLKLISTAALQFKVGSKVRIYKGDV